MNEPMVLDTSAIFAFVDDEEGADMVEKFLLMAKGKKTRLFASFVTLTELRYITMQERDESSADGLIGRVKSWPVEWVHSDDWICLLAARFKAERRVSTADAFVAATAHLLNAVVLHKDPEFESLQGIVQLCSLPYKV